MFVKKAKVRITVFFDASNKACNSCRSMACSVDGNLNMVFRKFRPTIRIINAKTFMMSELFGRQYMMRDNSGIILDHPWTVLNWRVRSLDRFRRTSVETGCQGFSKNNTKMERDG